MSTLLELQEWFLAHCDGKWEHGFGVTVQSLDNPGWAMSIALQGTPLENESFPPHEYGVGIDAETSGDNWLSCKVEDGQFRAAGGPEKLDEMISVFLKWARHAS